MALLDGTLKFALGVAPLSTSALTVMVWIERINGIRIGEENDIGKY